LSRVEFHKASSFFSGVLRALGWVVVAAFLVLAIMYRDNPTLLTAFLAGFFAALYGHFKKRQKA
jgi:hypothetical protein